MNRLCKEKDRKVRNLLELGIGNRAIRRLTGVHDMTIAKIRRMYLWDGVEFKCACGKAATHQGWCSHRYKLHPKMRLAIEMGVKNRKLKRQADKMWKAYDSDEH